jgi:hypothetical protein
VSIDTLAERLFRKNLAAQYVGPAHPFFDVENELIDKSVEEVRRQLLGVMTIHMSIAGIHVHVMERAEYLASCDDVSEVDEETLTSAIGGVERDSLEILGRFCTPAE